MRIFWAVILVLMANGCSVQPVPPREGPKMVPAMVGIVNHTGKYIYAAAVNGVGGGNMDEYSAGGANVCCAMIPETWRPQMTATIRVAFAVGRTRTSLSKVVEIEPYAQAASIYVHVFPDDVVRVVVSEYGGASTKHPIPAPVKPAGWRRQE